MPQMLIVSPSEVKLGDILAEGLQVWWIVSYSKTGMFTFWCGQSHEFSNHRFDFHRSDLVKVVR